MSYITHADLGGLDGFGPVTPEPEGELWHEAWEPRALALTLAMGATGAWNIDQSRSARETLPDYDRLNYYRIWLSALQRLMLERGLVTEAEITEARVQLAPKPLARVLMAENVAAVLARGSATGRPATTPPRFAVGDRVRTRSGHVDHHTRLPGYARGRAGTVERVHGTHVFADTNAQGLGEQAQWLYTIAFDGRELWGDEATPGLRVSVDAWDDYLEPA